MCHIMQDSAAIRLLHKTPPSTWRRFRQSKMLVVFGAFLAIFVDNSSMYLQMALAPSLIRDMRFYTCNCTEIQANGTSASFRLHSNKSVDIHVADNFTSPTFCRRDSEDVACYSPTDVMVLTADGIDLMNALGWLVQIIASPIVGKIVEKFGHRWPFVFGSLVQTMSAFLLMFAPKEFVLYIACALQGIAFTLIFVSGLTMLSKRFEGEEKTNYLSKTFAAGNAIAGLVAFPLGSFAYEIAGSKLPFGTLVSLAICDVIVRCLIDTEGYEKSKHEITEESPLIQETRKDCQVTCEKANGILGQEEKSESSKISHVVNSSEKEAKKGYKALLTDFFVWEVMIIVYLFAFIVAFETATAYNYTLNILHGSQWQLGIILCVGMSMKIALVVIFSGMLNKKIAWIYMMVGNVATLASFIVYPLSPSVWWTLIPEVAIRGVGNFPGAVILPNVYQFLIESRHSGCEANAFALQNLFLTLGFATGPFAGYLLRVISFMWLYYIMAGAVIVPLTLISFHAIYWGVRHEPVSSD